MSIDSLPARLTHQQAPDVARQLAASLGKSAESASGSAQDGGAEPWLISAAGLAHFDSSALAVLLECRRLAAARGRSIRVSDAPPKLIQLARLYGLDDLLAMPAADRDVAASTPTQA